jgi:pimeloyl-ACP methyl ester carboxylesterase
VSANPPQIRRRPRFEPFGPKPDPTPSDGPDPYGAPDPEWLGIDWRQFLHTINVPPASSSSTLVAAGSAQGTTVGYAEMGPPEPEQHPLAIVFVHGLSGCWQNWLENIPHFARRHRVLALDLPGFGSSPVPEWEISIPAYGRLLLEFCDALGVRDCAVVGNSMGGFVAAEAAISQPDRFEKLVLVSAAGVTSARLRREPTDVAARMIAAGTPLAFKAQTRAFRRPRARAMAFSGIFHSPSDLRPELVWEFFDGGMRAESFVEALSSLAGYDFLDRLGEVHVPSLIVWGRQDHVVPPADALGYAGRLAGSRLEVFDQCGHVPMAERPVRFNRLLDEFLAA